MRILLVVEGNPLEDIALLAADGRNLRVIMRAGELIKNELSRCVLIGGAG